MSEQLYSGPVPRAAPPPPVFRTLSFLNGMGDTTIGWTPNNDEWIIPLIRQKMLDGYDFWIIRRDPVREVKIRNATEATLTHEVIMKDDVARELIEQGRIGIVAAPAPGRRPEVVMERRAGTPEEAVAADTVAHRPLRGG